MKQYLELVEKIYTEGVTKAPAREGQVSTIGLSFAHMSFDMAEGFPLLTTKKMHWKGVVSELLWFLRGETNIKSLVDQKCHIWDKDAYRWYTRACDRTKQTPEPFTEFVKLIEMTSPEYLQVASAKYFTGDSDSYILGDLGSVYGHLWRDMHGVDQIAEVINGLKANPASRYHIIDAWDKSQFPNMVLPPCHLLYQFTCRPINHFDRVNLAWSTGFKQQYSEYSGTTGKFEHEWDIWMDSLNIPKYYLDLNMYQRKQYCAAA